MPSLKGTNYQRNYLSLSGTEIICIRHVGLAPDAIKFNSKDTARENLRGMLTDIARTARSMTYKFPDIELKFQLPKNLSDVNMLAAGHAFLTEATPYNNDFIDYEMDKNFLTDLQTLIAEFEAGLGAPGAATDSHVEATAEIGAEIRRGMIAVRTIKGAVMNKYRNDVGKLGAWLSALHIEKVPVVKPHPKNEPSNP